MDENIYHSGHSEERKCFVCEIERRKIMSGKIKRRVRRMLAMLLGHASRAKKQGLPLNALDIEGRSKGSGPYVGVRVTDRGLEINISELFVPWDELCASFEEGLE